MLSWEAAVAEDWLGKWAKNQTLINVSTRKFARSVRLPEGDIPAPMGSGMLKIGRFLIDGIHMDEDLILVAAIGVDAKGDKHPVGATENAATIQALVNNLVERRLDPAAEYLATNVCRTGVCGPTFLLRRGAGFHAARTRSSGQVALRGQGAGLAELAGASGARNWILGLSARSTAFEPVSAWRGLCCRETEF